MTGRRPIPTALKRQRGNPGKQRLNEHEPQPAVTTIDPPGNLKGRALRLWQEHVPELVRLGLLTVVDRDEFALFCRLRVYGRRMLKTKPSAALHALAQSSSIGKRYGIGAADRTRLIALPAPPASKWGGLIKSA